MSAPRQRCPHGFYLNERAKTCEDVDECTYSWGGCDVDHYCVNTLGGHECVCRSGFTHVGKDSTKCHDLNECLTDNGGCEHQCQNTLGGKQMVEAGGAVNVTDTDQNGEPEMHPFCYSAWVLDPTADLTKEPLCKPGPNHPHRMDAEHRHCFEQGYRFEPGGRCTDINECADPVTNGGCEHVCINTPGSFQCECLEGFVLAEDGLSCKDVNECVETRSTGEQPSDEAETLELKVDVCGGGVCINTPGGYRCEACPAGFTKYGETEEQEARPQARTTQLCGLVEVVKASTLLEAVQASQEKGGRLAALKTWDDSQFAEELLTSSELVTLPASLWLGMHRKVGELWKWLDGSLVNVDDLKSRYISIDEAGAPDKKKDACAVLHMTAQQAMSIKARPCGAQGGSAGELVFAAPQVLISKGPTSACNDGVRNGDEVGIDCGGSCAAKCPRKVIGESGKVRLGMKPKTVSITENLQYPVVLAGPPTARGIRPLVVRVGNMRRGGAGGATAEDIGPAPCPTGSKWCFDIHLQVGNVTDGWHKQERVDWLAVEAGLFRSDDGHLFQTGSVEVPGDRAFHAVLFDDPFPTPPLIVLQIQTSRGRSFVSSRVRHVTAGGFELALEGDGADLGNNHPTERVGWMAMEVSPKGFFGSRAFSSGRVHVANDRVVPIGKFPPHDEELPPEDGESAPPTASGAEGTTDTVTSEEERLGGGNRRRRNHFGKTTSPHVLASILTYRETTPLHVRAGHRSHKTANLTVERTLRDGGEVGSGRVYNETVGYFVLDEEKDSAPLEVVADTFQPTAIPPPSDFEAATQAGQIPIGETGSLFLTLGHPGGSDLHTGTDEAETTTALFKEKGWVTVRLQQVYTYPVVLAFPGPVKGLPLPRIRNVRPASASDPSCTPGGSRFMHAGGISAQGTSLDTDNVGTWCFDIKLQASPCRKSKAAARVHVSWIALQAGRYRTMEGLTVEANVADVVGDKHMHAVSLKAPFGTPPLVLTQLQTNEGTDYVETRIVNVTDHNFKLNLKDVSLTEVGRSIPHPTERVGYIALDAATSGHLGRRTFTAFKVTREDLQKGGEHLSLVYPRPFLDEEHDTLVNRYPMLFLAPQYSDPPPVDVEHNPASLRANDVDGQHAKVVYEDHGCATGFEESTDVETAPTSQSERTVSLPYGTTVAALAVAPSAFENVPYSNYPLMLPGENIAVEPVQPFTPSALVTIGESGRLKLSSEWTTVLLRRTLHGEGASASAAADEFADLLPPVVFLGPAFNRDSTEAVGRLKHLRRGQSTDYKCPSPDHWCFDARVEEASCRDKQHDPETVDILAIDRGSFIAAPPYDPTTDTSAAHAHSTLKLPFHVGATKVRGDGAFQWVVFPERFDAPPVVIAQVQSYLQGGYLVVRINKTHEDGFWMALQDDKVTLGGPSAGREHQDEVVGWMAMAPTVGGERKVPFGLFADREYMAVPYDGKGIDGQRRRVEFPKADRSIVFTSHSKPHLFAVPPTVRETHAVSVRLDSADSNGFEAHLCGEICSRGGDPSDKRAHLTNEPEDIFYLALNEAPTGSLVKTRSPLSEGSEAGSLFGAGRCLKGVEKEYSCWRVAHPGMKMSFAEGGEACTKDDILNPPTQSYLASVASPQEAYFVLTQICRSQGCWVGAKRHYEAAIDHGGTAGTGWQSPLDPHPGSLPPQHLGPLPDRLTDPAFNNVSSTIQVNQAQRHGHDRRAALSPVTPTPFWHLSLIERDRRRSAGIQWGCGQLRWGPQDAGSPLFLLAEVPCDQDLPAVCRRDAEATDRPARAPPGTEGFSVCRPSAAAAETPLEDVAASSVGGAEEDVLAVESDGSLPAPEGYSTSCVEEVTERVRDWCQGVHQCQVDPSNAGLNAVDRCPGTPKYLEVMMQCMSMQDFTARQEKLGATAALQLAELRRRRGR
ncbi:unnamed protein product [Vitrella brassicaformis CCMP3155]|uniref:EGF-like domain-containing protein n=2 Tax=Vitrella brassicaformis TaxID=1169539 RepID=A0A0G4EU29_VITBC|nr:unnamed protein product [Vitrella brassicaformis CCMP3155]|eukprot:CEM01905.1 unnamed protein product [Vitrella brassicaformis CCMP3155]